MSFRSGAFVPMFGVSVVAAVLVALLSTAAAQPTNPECFEACSIDQVVATGAIVLVALAWLVVVIAMAWRLHRREPAVAAVSAIVAALFVTVMAGFDTSLFVSPSSFDSPIFVFDQLILVVAMGVQLPAIWRLAASAAPGDRPRGGHRRRPGDPCRRRGDRRARHHAVRFRTAGAVRHVPRLLGRRGDPCGGLMALGPGESDRVWHCWAGPPRLTP